MQRKFKIGDRVRCVSYCAQFGMWNDTCEVRTGDVCTVVAYGARPEVAGEDRIDVIAHRTGGINHSARAENFELHSAGVTGEAIIIKNTMTTIIDKVKLALKAEPQKTLIGKGLLTSDESLTDEGRRVLEFLLVQEYAEKMKKAVDAVPKED